MNQRGFATLEVILMVMVIGILASIAVPRFTAVTAAANTAKIQADLTTIDTAIAVYEMEKGSPPSGTDINVLAGYIRGVESNSVTLTPPTGKCYMGGDSPVSIPENNGYALQQPDEGSNDEVRAVLGGHTAEDFYRGTDDSSDGD